MKCFTTTDRHKGDVAQRRIGAGFDVQERKLDLLVAIGRDILG